MSYYSGDWYRGDFYRGDPGFWSSIFNIGKAAAGFIPGVGGVVQGALGALGPKPTLTSTIASSMIPVKGTAAMATAGKSLIRRGAAAVKGHPVLSAAGAAGAIGSAAAVMSPGVRHAAGRMLMGHQKKRRRMNVCNPRALRRAIRRTHGFAKLAMKTIHIVHPKKRGTFGGFRRRRAGAGSRRR